MPLSATSSGCVRVPDRIETQIRNCDDVSESGRQVVGDAVQLLKKIYDEVLPDPEVRFCDQSIRARSCIGQRLPNLIILNGNGRNGKGLLGTLLDKAQGEYAYKLPIAVLGKPIDTGPNPELAKMNKKRGVRSAEPEGSKGRVKICNSTYKDITGDNIVAARACYSNDMVVNIMCTLMIECNDRPKFTEEITDADRERLIDIHFPNRFTIYEHEVDPTKGIFPVNPEYEKVAFFDNLKYAMMELMFDTYKKTGGQIYVPESVRQRTLEYLSMNNWTVEWFAHNYEKMENPFATDFINISKIIEKMHASEKFKLLTAREREREYNLQYIIETFKSSIYSTAYRAEYRVQRNNNRIQTTHVLLGFKKRVFFKTTKVAITEVDEADKTE